MRIQISAFMSRYKIRLLNFHACIYSWRGTITLLIETIEDICYYYLTWLLKGRFFNVRFVSLECDNISRDTYLYIRSLVMLLLIISSFHHNKNSICTESLSLVNCILIFHTASYVSFIFSLEYYTFWISSTLSPSQPSKECHPWLYHIISCVS